MRLIYNDYRAKNRGKLKTFADVKHQLNDLSIAMLDLDNSLKQEWATKKANKVTLNDLNQKFEFHKQENEGIETKKSELERTYQLVCSEETYQKSALASFQKEMRKRCFEMERERYEKAYFKARLRAKAKVNELRQKTNS